MCEIQWIKMHGETVIKKSELFDVYFTVSIKQQGSVLTSWTSSKSSSSFFFLLQYVVLLKHSQMFRQLSRTLFSTCLFKRKHCLHLHPVQHPAGHGGSAVYGVGSAAARLLGLWVRIPPWSWMCVCCDCRVWTGKDFSVGLITRPEESYTVWRVWIRLWSLENEEALDH